MTGVSPNGWRTLLSGGEGHAVPIGDLIDHVLTDCPCGPRTEAVAHPDGSFGWIVVHHSLDGREASE